MVSLATVYKTSELLTEMGVVLELSFVDGARYELYGYCGECKSKGQ